MRQTVGECAHATHSAHDKTRLPLLILKSRARVRPRHERKRSNLKKDRLEVLAVTLKPFEELCPRMKAPWPGPIR